jgi:hypothetical protein
VAMKGRWRARATRRGKGHHITARFSALAAIRACRCGAVRSPPGCQAQLRGAPAQVLDLRQPSPKCEGHRHQDCPRDIA